MPTEIRCRKCDSILGEWPELPTGVNPWTLWYEHFYKKMKGECVVCHCKLPSPKEYADKMKVQIKPFEIVRVEK